MKTRVNTRPDGLHEVLRVDFVRHVAVAATVTLAALPLLLMIVLALVAVMPLLALASRQHSSLVPPALPIGFTSTIGNALLPLSCRSLSAPSDTSPLEVVAS